MIFVYEFAKDKIRQCNFDLSVNFEIPATCVVRNDKGKGRNNRALMDPTQVVYAMDGDRYNRHAYMPQQFPRGTWTIKEPYPVDEADPEYKYKGPWMIPTDAFQMVQVWHLHTETGGYLKPTSEWVKDWGYAIHSSESRTTLGCIINSEPDLMSMKRRVDDCFYRKEPVYLEVR